MTTASISSKDQITIPADVRQALNVGKGDRVEFVEIEEARYEFAAATRSVTEFKGMFGKAKRAVSIEEMIIRAKQLKIESADPVVRALRVFKGGKSDFADCLIERSANSVGCEKTLTFDISASKYAGMTLIA